MRRSAILLVIAALIAGWQVPAAAKPAEDGFLVPGLPVYLALGDSIAWGQGATDPAVGGYVPLFRSDLIEDLDCLPATSPNARDGCKQLQLLNLARPAIADLGLPGVTSQIVIDEQLAPSIELLGARNGDSNPRNDVEVVTLTVGGNDVFSPVFQACVLGVGDCVATVTAVFGAYAANLHTILAALRTAGGDDLVVVTMTYYNPLGSCALGAVPGAIAAGDMILEGGGLLPLGFNDVIRAVSAAHGALVADTFGVLDEQSDFVGGPDCLHITDSGHAKVAAVFDEVFSG